MFSNKAKMNTKNSKDESSPDRNRWNALLFTLWVSRLFGIAPVRFQKNIPGFPVTVSDGISRYSKLFIVFIHCVSLAGTITDWQEGKHGIRLRGNWARFAFVAEVVLVISISSVAAFGAPQRLRRSIVYLNVIDKIKSNIEHPRRQKRTKIGLVMTILYIIWSFWLNSVDYFTFFADSYNEGKDYTLMYYYICFYTELLVVMLIELQFTWIATLAHSGLAAVNDNLEELIYLVDLQRSSKHDWLHFGNGRIPMSVASVNTLVDRMDNLEFQHAAAAPRTETPKYILESIRTLSISYGTVCDVICGINNDFGSLLMLLIVSFVLHLVVTPFYFLNYWYSNKPRKVNLTVQILFVCYHFIHLMLAVEPGYQTEMQNERTLTLTRQLMQRARSSQDPMLDELDLMMKHISLNKVYYSPMGFCKLTRSLIKVILGGATTYLVIILQFQRMVAGDW